MAKKLIAVVSALAMLLSLAACSGKTENNEPKEPEAQSVDEIVSQEAEETAAEQTTEEPTTEEPTTEEPTTEEPTTEEDRIPESKEEIIELFNDSVNRVKSEAKSITSNYMAHTRSGKITGLPGGIEGIMKILGGVDGFVDNFMGKDKTFTDKTWTGSEMKKFPVENEDWASKLRPEDVAEASIKEENGKYKIKIRTVADGASSDIQHGKGHNARLFNVVLPAIIDDNMPKPVARLFNVGTISLDYPSSTVTAVIDPESGLMENALYSFNWTIHIPLGKDLVLLPFNTENSYTINW